HFAALLAARGARVMAAARRADRLGELVAQITKDGGTATSVSLDVTDPASVDAAIEATLRAYGRLDIIVNNAGTTHSGPVLDLEIDDWRAVMAVNLDGAFLVAQRGARAMAASGGGTIVNVTSLLARKVHKGLTAYAASKAGAEHMTRALALELARFKIRVNALAPGYFATEMTTEFLETDAAKLMISQTPQRRVGDSHDLDGALLLLASDAGAYITGTTIIVDGGHGLVTP
ncbi:MAG: SDR family NAD(P)-dependent oxidoreductase, partial [Alphaproteobacteria bacterium]